MAARRALHFVFKVGDRARTARFYRELLGMRVSGGGCAAGLLVTGGAAPALAPERGPGDGNGWGSGDWD